MAHLESILKMKILPSTLMQLRLNTTHAAAANALHKSSANSAEKFLTVSGKQYKHDSWTNVTPRIISHIGRNIYLKQNHPLWLIKERLIAFFHWKYQNRRSPSFAVIDNLSPVVTPEQNLTRSSCRPTIPAGSLSDSYYINKDHLLRAHTSAHQRDLLRSGLREFLAIGDVYRRDEIEPTHFPVFHQIEGVRLRYAHELKDDPEFRAIESPPGEQTLTKQASHTQEAVDLMTKIYRIVWKVNLDRI
ncbi:putative Phenylalanine--tRNA ligase, mitochondrial [Hypsibius exemplaris]|uniref:Phenylalanine--tRNA ligase, mitochondrial n=1 Tax=Hypsibius exemplaris TaxID=2072580 RepID=A0A1W0WVA7_HYPEX|nr:putative Phenylalanine--tRNA ligase, mitochondrial [Hypsibius exemplaris]